MMQHRRRIDTSGSSTSQVTLPYADDDKSKTDSSPSATRRRRQIPARSPVVRRSSSSSNSAAISCCNFFVVLLFIAMGTVGFFFAKKHEQAQLENLRKNLMETQVEPIARKWEEKYANLLEENEKLQREVVELEDLRSNKKQFLEQEGLLKKLQEDQEKSISYYKKYSKDIQNRIQAMSRSLTLDKFGSGPHMVEIMLAFDPEFPKRDDTDEDHARIVIQLAPIDEMPHVVYWFLEQVSRGLYDGCSFHRNAGHVIQGGPAPNFLSPPNPALHKRFTDAGFHSVLFQEYSPQFPHEKYTLGFAGRPGGPDFYISTRDNTKNHGPGGQTSYEDPDEADPCFARVVEGTDVVDRMQSSPNKPGNYHAMVHNVAILSMKIMPTTES